MTTHQSDDETRVDPHSQDMDELLDAADSLKPLRRGEIVEGVVMRVDSEGIHVDIGHKAEGFVSVGEMKTLKLAQGNSLDVGDSITTMVVRPEGSDGQTFLSVDRAAGEYGWAVLTQRLESGESVKGKILGFNRGGAVVDVENVQGFIPVSQLVSVSKDVIRDFEVQPLANPQEDGGEHPKPDEGPRNSDVGKELTLNVIEISRDRNRAIFSERQYLDKHRHAQKLKLIDELQEGEVRKGKVTGVSTFGAFVDLGGADGLVHISEMSWAPVGSPEEIVQVGQELDVYILKIDASNAKIALSIKRLQPEPWETISQQYAVGEIIDGTITKLTNFGAFARVGDMESGGVVEGLIHISELTDKMINHPREAVVGGDVVKLKILRIEPERHRLALSLKQADDEEILGGVGDDAI